MNIEIERVPVEKILDIRHRVLRAGLPFDSARFDGDNLPDSVHLAALQNGIVIGSATILLNTWESHPACQLRGMAVDPSIQSQGIGTLLLNRVHQVAMEKGVKILWANARTPAVPFYCKQGWEVVSAEFTIPTAGPHFKIVRTLP
jgi:GNAT superfamily N-acetyltransferase